MYGMKYLGWSHTHLHIKTALVHTHAQNVKEMRRRGSGCTYKYISTYCRLQQTFKWNHINTHIPRVRTQMYTLYNNMNMYSFTFRSEHAVTHTNGTYCIAPRHTFTHRALPVTDVGRNIARKKALSFLFILSVFWHAYLCTQCGHVTEAAVSFFSHLFCARFFFLLCYHHEIEVICAKRD